MAKPKLTYKQEALLKAIPQELRRETALAYISLGYTNQTEAYLNACKSINKKPSKNPHTSASEILSYPNTLEFIDSIKEEVAKAAKIDSSYVLRRLKEIDELDILDIVKDDLSGFKLLSEWPKVWRTSISSLDMKRIVTKIQDGDDIETLVEKIKWPDKVKNLEMIGRHVDVKAWDKEAEGTSDNLAESLNKLIDKLPN